MAYNTFEMDENTSGMKYDLREIYAKIVGTICAKIVEEREHKQYQLWFEQMKNLYIEIDRKLTNKEREDYKRLIDETHTIINKFPNTYTTGNGTKESVGNIEKKLTELNLFLNNLMEKHEMAGGSEDDRGL